LVDLLLPLASSISHSFIHSFSPRSLFGWLVADGWCWFVLREEYCWLVAGGWFVLREKYCWLVADKPSEQGAGFPPAAAPTPTPTPTSLACFAIYS
jgi:hypothetical protein